MYDLPALSMETLTGSVSKPVTLCRFGKTQAREGLRNRIR